MPITIIKPLGRLPTFAELCALAGEHGLQINGNGLAGDFCCPNLDRAKVTGHYAIDPSGNIRGGFDGHSLGKLAGSFALANGKAEVTITEKPFLLPEAILSSKISEALKKFCARFH